MASGRSRRTATTTRAPDDAHETGRCKSAASTKAPTVVPSDSISQAGDRLEIVSSRNESRSARASQSGGSHAGSQRLTAAALEELSERNSNVGRAKTITHEVEVIEETSGKPSTRSRAASKSGRSSHPAPQSARVESVYSSHVSPKSVGPVSKVPSKAASRATTRQPSVAASKAQSSYVDDKRDAKSASGAASRAVSAAPSHRSSRHTAVEVVEVTEQAERDTQRARSVAPSHHSRTNLIETDEEIVYAAAAARSVAPSQARSREPSRAASKAQSTTSSHHTEVKQAKSVASRASSHHSTAKPAKSVASRAPSHASSYHSGTTATKSATSHDTSHHSSRHSSHHSSHHDEHSTTPTTPTSPAAPQPPAAFEEKVVESSSEAKVEEDLQLVKRSSYDVVAPRNTTVDVVEWRRRDGRLMERDYAILP